VPTLRMRGATPPLSIRLHALELW